MDSENYGTLVKNLRLKNGLTQHQVADSLVGCSLDSLVGDLEPEYSETALDRKLYQTILKLDIETKEKLLQTLEIWSK